MLPSFVLALREGLETALIIGIVLGALHKVNKTALRPTVWGGALAASGFSLAAAILLTRIGTSLEGQTEGIFEGATMLLAGGVLTWMIFWMQRQSRHIKNELETGVRRAAGQAGKVALFFLAFVAVLREGIELALFLTAAALASGSGQALWGGLLGLATAALLGWALFSTTMRLDLRRFFQVTSILLVLFAAGLVAHGIHEFNEVGWIPGLIAPIWDINSLVDEASALGRLFQALFGYNGDPSLTEVLGYVGYFAILWVALRRSLPSLPARETA